MRVFLDFGASGLARPRTVRTTLRTVPVARADEARADRRWNLNSRSLHPGTCAPTWPRDPQPGNGNGHSQPRKHSSGQSTGNNKAKFAHWQHHGSFPYIQSSAHATKTLSCLEQLDYYDPTPQKVKKMDQK